jgi:hypothetical protein
MTGPNTKDSDKDVTSKQGHKIDVGDEVYTRMRGGHREGQVSSTIASEAFPILPVARDPHLIPIQLCHCRTRLFQHLLTTVQVENIVTTEDEAREANVKNPPKVRDKRSAEVWNSSWVT